MTKFLDAALRYAELGYRVFPCVPNGKAPLTRHGFYDATTDPRRLERWWKKQPSANLGLATQRLIVIDIDGAGNTWPNDAECGADLSAAPLSLTPRDGSHRIFRQPAGKAWRNTESRLGPRVDTRADGGYIVAPPSVLAEGSYRWAPGMELDEPLDRLPEPPPWLVLELDRLAGKAPTIAQDARSRVPANEIPEGQHNATLARLGGVMRRVGMTATEIAAALHRVNSDRCHPPLDAREVERIAVSIARYPPDEIAVALIENHYDQMFPQEAR